MGEHKLEFWFSLIVGPFIGGVAGYFIAASVLAEYSWCIRGEEHCVRDWIAALSGWAGVLAATIALFPFYAQAREAKRQADFATGEMFPEFRVGRNRTHPNVIVRVTNWNRRRIMINSFRLISPDALVLANVIPTRTESDERVTHSKKKLQTPRKPPGFGVSGWLDRGSGPLQRRFAIGLTSDGVLADTDTVFAQHITLEIEYTLLGDRRVTRTISVTTEHA